MARALTAADRSRLIKLASKMPVGSPERKAILAGLSKSDAEKVKGMLVKYIEQTHKMASGSKEARYRSWGKSTSADVMNNWRSKDTPAEQRESLGRSMADAYEVIQTVLMLSKKTEGADPQSVHKALQAIGAAMFGH